MKLKGQIKPIPCGKCHLCLEQKRREWVLRMKLELNNQLQNGAFLTLTYNDEEIKDLNKEDIQKFHKRLRKKYGRIKYFITGEYGERFGRPHYHEIIFMDKKVIKTEWEDVWKKGNVFVGTVTERSLAYCVAYGLKNSGKRSFKTMSKGLGKEPLMKLKKEALRDGYIQMNGRKFSIPRYAIKIWNLNEKELDNLKNKCNNEKNWLKENFGEGTGEQKEKNWLAKQKLKGAKI